MATPDSWTREAALGLFSLAALPSDCQVHRRAVELYCTSCSKAFCILCIRAHPAHIIVPLVEEAARLRQSFTAQIAPGQPLSACAKKLSEVCSALDALPGDTEAARLRVTEACDAARAATAKLAELGAASVPAAVSTGRASLEALRARAVELMAVRLQPGDGVKTGSSQHLLSTTPFADNSRTSCFNVGC